MSCLEELDHLRIPLDDIISATDNFSQHKFLAKGGFGMVYKGQLPPTPGQPGRGTTDVAVKRLDPKGRQGDREFLMEILMLASYKHANLASLIGFADQGGEKILVYKHEDNGSLDTHVSSTNLVWEQRLRICLGAARGLEYLHSGVGTGHRVIHRDIKSSNILLDADWEAKISDFGLSKIGLKDQPYSFLVTMACGTLGYVDPAYIKTQVLTKESDVYSFGVVLFEVLCGRLATIGKYKDKHMSLSRMVKNYYGDGKLEDIIFHSLVTQMKPGTLDIFSKIAFRCLNDVVKLRPTMRSIVQELESALEHQLGKPITEPERQIGTLTKLWGSKTGGNPFSFRLGRNQKLRRITIYHKIFIEGLTFRIKDSNGLLHFKHYGTRPSYYPYMMGIIGDTQEFEIDLDGNEEIIGLSGSVGVYNGHELVTSLCVTTNERKYGPFNHEADNRFSGSWDAGLFDGFYGRAGTYIDSVGCRLKPATTTTTTTSVATTTTTTSSVARLISRYS